MKFLTLLYAVLCSVSISSCLKPVRVGTLQTIESSGNGNTSVSGLMFLLDNNTIFIKDFIIVASQAYFCAGNQESTFVIPAEHSRTPQYYSGSNLELGLPDGNTVACLSWFGVCSDPQGTVKIAKIDIHPGLVASVPSSARFLGDFHSDSHNITGLLYYINRLTFAILCFSYPQEVNEDAIFWTGTNSPSVHGFPCTYGDDVSTSLPPIEDQDLLIRIPESRENVPVTYLALWSRSSTRALSYVSFSRDVFPTPPPAVDSVYLADITGRAHQVRGTVYAVDSKTYIVTGFNFDGNAPAVYIRAVKGSHIFSNEHAQVIVNGESIQPLGRYEDSYITLTLPDGYTVHNTRFIAVWCYAFDLNFGEARVGDRVIDFALDPTTPVDPPLPPIMIEPIDSKVPVNCKQLNSELTMSWVLNSQSNEINIMLCGCVLADNYVAFGLSGSDLGIRMFGGDVTVTWLDNSGVHAQDFGINAYSQCRVTGTNGGGTLRNGVCPDEHNDVHSVSGFRDGCKTCIKFSRPLSSGDPYDTNFATSMLQWVIWAVGPMGTVQTFTGDTLRVPFKHYLRADYGDSLQVNFSRTPIDECNLTCSDSDCRVELRPWPQPKLDHSFTIHTHIGQSGGQRGYAGITGISGWGIAWYLNGVLIPRITLYRHLTYTFIVEGGDNPNNPARYHPFYITSSVRGGYLALSEDERKDETLYAGFDDNGNPIGVGRYCEYRSNINPDGFERFDGYQETLELVCDDGEAGSFTWTPDDSTPDVVYYQCASHQFLGWTISIEDPPPEFLPVEIDVYGGTPFVQFDTFEVRYDLSKAVEEVTCELRKGKEQYKPINCGYLAFNSYRINNTGVLPGEYMLRIRADNGPGDKDVYRTKFTVPDDPSDCYAYLTNNGVVMQDDVTEIHFSSTGLYEEFGCNIDGGPQEACVSPLELKNLTTGRHKVRIIARGCVGDSYRRVVNFNIYQNGTITYDEECPTDDVHTTSIHPTPSSTTFPVPSTTPDIELSHTVQTGVPLSTNMAIMSPVPTLYHSVVFTNSPMPSSSDTLHSQQPPLSTTEGVQMTSTLTLTPTPTLSAVNTSVGRQEKSCIIVLFTVSVTSLLILNT